MGNVYQVCRVCGDPISSGFLQCDGCYFQNEDSSDASTKEANAKLSKDTTPQWHDN